MKRMQKVLSFLLALTLCLTALLAGASAAENTPEVTRAQWIGDLVAAFEMSVEEDNYPDNYYSDISDADDFYRDIMVAVEFGVVELEAGSAFEPDAAATREFAAQTLNHCLGFQLDANAQYTYTDIGEVTYTDAVQVAVNRGWFALSGGKFLPKQAVTAAEAEAMLDDAKAVLAGDVSDGTNVNTSTLADGVIEVPQGTAITMDAAGNIVIADCPVEIAAGDVFVVYEGDLPLAFTALAVATDDNGALVITATTEGADGAITALNYEGIVEVDLQHFQPSESTTYQLNELTVTEGPTLYGINYDSGKKVLTASKTISLGEGISATINFKMSNMTLDTRMKWMDCRVVLDGDATLTTNVRMDLLASMGAPRSIELGRVPLLYGAGYIRVVAEYDLSGEVNLVWSGDVSTGFSFTDYDGFRVINNFNKKDFTFMTEVNLETGLSLECGVETWVVDAEVWASMGAHMTAKTSTFSSGTPMTCLDTTGYLYVRMGAYASFAWGKTYSKTVDVYSAHNSPIRQHFHVEDGVQVLSCTRGKESGATDSNYYTSPSSRYFTPGFSNASSSFTTAGGTKVTLFTYTLDENDNATITGYKGWAGSLRIPSTIDGYPVTAIGYQAFYGDTGLYGVVIPDSVTFIGDYAFYNCTNLSVVTLSKNLTTLGYSAFENCALSEIFIPKSLTSVESEVFNGCTGLNTIHFEEGITKIPAYLFSYCPGLKSIVIPDTVTSIGYEAFYYCKNLKSVTIPNSVTTIGGYAFAHCTGLTGITIPDSVTSIGDYAFYDSTNLSAVTLSKNLTTLGYSAFENCALSEIFIPKSLTSVESEVFNGCTGLNTIHFEEGITKIPAYLFSYCPGLKNIVIPDTVTSIGYEAFYYCKNLASVTIPNSVTTIGGYAFAHCTGLTGITIPDSVTSIGDYAFYDSTNLSVVTLSNNLTTLGHSAFENCALSEIFIPKSLTSVGSEVFNGCTNLNTIHFEEGITKIPAYLFSYCPGLKNIVIPDTVKTIGYEAFYYCSGLESVTIPNSVTTINSYAFAHCTNLNGVVIPDSVTTLGDYAFRDCTKLAAVTLNEGLQTINDYVFQNCSSLKEIVIPNSVTSMGTYIFSGCTSLEKAVLPNTRKNVTEGTFKDCTSLTTVALPETVTNIALYAFKNCDALESIALPNGLLTIGNQAFYDCDALTGITIPDSVTSIGTSAFYGCEVLKNVTLGTGLTQIAASTFQLCPALEEIVIPYRVTTLGNNAFNSCTGLTKVTLPRSVTSIGTTAFSYPDRMTIYGVAGTYAETYATTNGFAFVDQQVNAAAVALNHTELSINKGATATLVLSVTPANFTDEVTWKSTDTSIATVSSAGVVTAKALGTATIKVTVGNLSATCKITVKQPVTSITLNKTSLSLEALATYTLTATANPSTAENRAIAWSTSDPTVATVSESGLVTALKKGTATITASALDGSGVTKNCTVTVTNTAHVASTPDELESPHNYENNCKDFWVYTLPGATELHVTFDERTNIEEDFDYLYIYTGSGTQVGEYTGTALAGQTVTVSGDTVRIKLVSDESGSTWGFKVSNVTGDGLLNGLYQDTDGVWRYYANGKVDTKYAGLVEYYGNKFYVANGVLDATYTGLVFHDGSWCYVSGGMQNTAYAGLVFNYDNWYYVSNGVVNWTTGLVDHFGTLYYVSNGKMDTGFAGLVEYNGQQYYAAYGAAAVSYTGFALCGEDWYYVVNGIVAEDYSGLLALSGSIYYVVNGKLNTDYAGLVDHYGTKYYVACGVVAASYTGLTLHDGSWYYITYGLLADSYTGLLTLNGSIYYVVNGALANYSGLVEHGGDWYYVSGGVVANGYTGLALHGGDWVYVSNGILNRDYVGLVESGGSLFYVSGGVINWGFSGTVDGYRVENGMVVG